MPVFQAIWRLRTSNKTSVPAGQGYDVTYGDQLSTSHRDASFRDNLMTTDAQTGIIIVDHGSRLAASNDMLTQAVAAFASQSPYAIVEPAHMELAQPDIATAFGRCVSRGARRVVVFPYFLSPGRHWTTDIPALVAAAAGSHPGVEWLVTAPFALHPAISGIIRDRISACLTDAERSGPRSGCDACTADTRCRIQGAESPADDARGDQ